MHPMIPISYNYIIVVAICQLMVFLIDLSKAYPSMVAVIIPEAKSCGVHPLIFLFFSHKCPIFSLLPSDVLLHRVDLKGFGLSTSPVGPSFPPCLMSVCVRILYMQWVYVCACMLCYKNSELSPRWECMQMVLHAGVITLHMSTLSFNSCVFIRTCRCIHDV